jgi:hypothetical protein
MTDGELVDMLIKWAVEFRKDEDFFKRNKHMFSSLAGSPSALQKDAVLTGFLSFAANKCGIDLGMYMEDFLQEVRKQS